MPIPPRVLAYSALSSEEDSPILNEKGERGLMTATPREEPTRGPSPGAPNEQREGEPDGEHVNTIRKKSRKGRNARKKAAKRMVAAKVLPKVDSLLKPIIPPSIKKHFKDGEYMPHAKEVEARDKFFKRSSRWSLSNKKTAPPHCTYSHPMMRTLSPPLRS
jgi:hypothetical protein